MNRRRHANVIPIFSLLTWLVLIAALCAGGIYYVNFKNQLLARGSQIKQLEKKLAELRNENEVAQTSIDRLASPNALRKRRETERGFLTGYVGIAQTSLVLYQEKSATELRPVSNEDAR